MHIPRTHPPDRTLLSAAVHWYLRLIYPSAVVIVQYLRNDHQRHIGDKLVAWDWTCAAVCWSCWLGSRHFDIEISWVKRHAVEGWSSCGDETADYMYLYPSEL